MKSGQTTRTRHAKIHGTLSSADPTLVGEMAGRGVYLTYRKMDPAVPESLPCCCHFQKGTGRGSRRCAQKVNRVSGASGSTFAMTTRTEHLAVSLYSWEHTSTSTTGVMSTDGDTDRSPHWEGLLPSLLVSLLSRNVTCGPVAGCRGSRAPQSRSEGGSIAPG